MSHLANNTRAPELNGQVSDGYLPAARSASFHFQSSRQLLCGPQMLVKEQQGRPLPKPDAPKHLGCEIPL